MTLFSFYQPGKIVQGNVEIIQVSSWLLLIGILAFAIGIELFRRRDLPL